MKNIDSKTVRGFGDEWSRFDQSELSDSERERISRDYFSLFPWDRLDSKNCVGADIGCGSGRWALSIIPKVKKLYLVDASQEALQVARVNLKSCSNTDFVHASVDQLPFPDQSLDFAYSLGVLHHVPDTEAAIKSVVAKLKPGAPFLLYLYYAFDTSPLWYRSVWRASDLLRRGISRFPMGLRYAVSQALAAGVYWPLARTAAVLERAQRLPRHWPLAYYRDKSFYVMRTDSLDRFGTRLEQRFSRAQIKRMLENAGMGEIRFSDHAPYWVAVAIKNA